jgi:amidophosphoribosyltransferase
MPFDECDPRFDKFHEECGVMAVYGHPDAANLVMRGLHALQHRGQESAGIAAVKEGVITCRKGMGLVTDVFVDRAALADLGGHAAIGHTRYSTAGDSAELNAQPFAVRCNKGPIALAHNGNITNAAELRAALEAKGSIFQATSDTEAVLHLVARSEEKTMARALRDALLDLEGAFSLVFLCEDRVIVARDPKGFRPLAMGQMEQENGKIAYVFASETCALDIINATYLCEVEPGEMVTAGPNGLVRERYAPAGDRSMCVFEHVYFARPDSLVFGRHVMESREAMGRMLARTAPAPADLVVPVPDSGVAAALGYAAESGLPFGFGLIRNHYVGRTFIQPTQEIRDESVRNKLNPVRYLLKDRSVVLIDDSIVRGTTSKKIVRMVRDAGAREVHVRISCPPTISPCFYGVDTPQKSELIANNHSVEEIRKFIEADSLAYLPLAALRQAVADENIEYCYACYTGNYPTAIENLEILTNAKSQR